MSPPTSSPWHTIGRAQSVEICAGDLDVATVWTSGTDAKLIAGAPEMAEALEAVLLFHRGGQWTSQDAADWQRLTGTHDATTKNLCDCIRARLRAAGRMP